MRIIKLHGRDYEIVISSEKFLFAGPSMTPKGERIIGESAVYIFGIPDPFFVMHTLDEIIQLLSDRVEPVPRLVGFPGGE